MTPLESTGTQQDRIERLTAALDEAEAYLAAGASWTNDDLENPIMARACAMGCREGLEKIRVRRDAIAMEARQGRDAEERPDPKDDSAGPQDIAQGGSHDSTT